MVLSPGTELHLASLWAAYKAWCEFCLCKCSIKGTNLPAPRLLPLESFCIHFSNDNSLYPTPFPPPHKADLLKKAPYMVILLTHRQLAFLGTLLKEDPPLGFYIALVFMSKTHQPSVTGRRTSHTLGEYCTASAVSIFLGLPDPWVQEAPPDWPGFCDAGPGHTSRPSVCNSAYKHTAACQEKVFLAMGHPGAGTAWNGTPCPPNWVVGGMCHLRSLLSLLIRASADLHP